MEADKRHQVIHLLRGVDHMMKCSIDRRVKITGLYRSQHRMLMFLGDYPDCSQTELAEKLEISGAAVAVSLKRLEKAGYIKRQCDTEDNRMNHMVITEKGKAAIEESKDFFYEIEGAALYGFSEKEILKMEEFLNRVLQNKDKINQVVKKSGA